jgi:hypothetical protein
VGQLDLFFEDPEKKRERLRGLGWEETKSPYSGNSYWRPPEGGGWKLEYEAFHWLENQEEKPICPDPEAGAAKS